MSQTFTLTSFTPAEAERITGVSNTQQRDWRRRGFLPAHEGHARFDAFALSEMLMLKLLTDRGIGPSEASRCAADCGTIIVWHALALQGAYEGTELADTPEDYEAFHLRPAFWRHRDLPSEMGDRFFVWWPEGGWSWHASIDEAFNRHDWIDDYEEILPPDQICGASIVMDQKLLGRMLQKRAERALLRVEYNR